MLNGLQPTVSRHKIETPSDNLRFKLYHQPSLPESVFLSLVQTENTEWERNQLIMDFMKLNKKAANNSEVITIGQMNEDFLMNQLHYKYFEGDIIGYETTWSNGKVLDNTKAK